MPIVRDGEKYACKQCIQGHRVSGCNHIDRPLQHVNKKGRPVSQCPHCRGLRRSRQTHIKCECGERRHSHSRNNSSESASLDDEGSCKCKCASGKKCTCALKKDVPESEVTRVVNAASAQSQRKAAMRWMPPRRSESSVPMLPNTSPTFGTNQPAPGLGMYLQTQGPYQLGRNLHIGQRSVDSLPLSSSSTVQYPLPRMRNPSYDHQFLNPEYAMQQQLNVPQPLNEQMGMDFQIHLDQKTIDKTLSPHNTKRYSMNDFSMLAGMHDQQLFPNSASSEPQQYPFQDYRTHDFALPVFSGAATQNPAPQSVASTEFTFPTLSRSSSGDTSDLADASFVNPMGQSPRTVVTTESGETMFMTHTTHSPQPIITIDPSWEFQHLEGTEKGAYDFAQSSLRDTPSEYAPSPFDDATLPPIYDMDMESGNNGVNPFSTEPPSGGLNDFPMPSQDYNMQGEIKSDFSLRSLPDRSARNYSSSPQSTLDMDFRFPNAEFANNDSYAGSPLRQGWSPMTDGTGMTEDMESAH